MSRRRIIQLIIFICTIVVMLGMAASARAADEAPYIGINWIAYTGSLIVYFLLVGVLKVVGFLSSALQVLLRVPINLAVVESMWRIIRDFSNMLFILVMIVMAFGTIFDIGGYRLDGKLLTRLIVVAVLINFSLVLSGLVIDGLNTVNQVFIRGIGDVGGRFQAVFSEQLLLGGAGNQISQIAQAAGGESGCAVGATVAVGNIPKIGSAINCLKGLRSAAQVFDTGSFALMFQIFFSLILSIIAMFSLLVPTFFALLRIPFLWFLVVFSPLMGLLSVLPATKQVWDNWIKEFVAWNVYMPVYLIGLYFGLYFIAQQNTIIVRLQGAFPAGFWSEPIQGVGYSFQFLFFFVVAAIVLWAGTAFALSFSRISGTMAAEYGTKWSQNAATGVRDWMGDFTRIRPTYQGLKEAGEAQIERIRKEGLFGGKPATERWRAGTAEMFGATGAGERQQGAQIKYFKDKFNNENYSAERLWAIAGNEQANRIQRLAAFERLKELKQLGGDSQLEAYKIYGMGTKSAAEFAKDIDFEKMSRQERQTWFDDEEVTNPIRYRIADAMAKEGEMGLKWNDKNAAGQDIPPTEDVDLKKNRLRRMVNIISKDNTDQRLLDQAKKETDKDKKADLEFQARSKANKMLYNFLITTAKKNPAEAIHMAQEFFVYDPNKNPRDSKAYIRFDNNDLYRNVKKRKAGDWPSILNIDLFTKDITLLNNDQKRLREVMVQVLAENTSIAGEIRKKDLSQEQMEALKILEEEAKKRIATGGTPPPTPGGAGGLAGQGGTSTGTTVGIQFDNPKNVVDLRET